jgi:prepilin-type N-terminal cleavage/methylation domain-containing protein
MQIKNTLGFTLIELLIALMITGIMTAIAVPRFSGLIKNYTFMSAARIIWLDLHRAKMMAIKQGKTMRVDFNATSYNIVRVDTSAVVLSRNLSLAYPNITLGCPNRLLALDRFWDLQCQSRFSHAWWRSIFNEQGVIQACQLRPTGIFTTS